MKVAELKERKRELGYTNEELSTLSGVPLGTVNKIFGGGTKSPRRSTLEALERALWPSAPAARYPAFEESAATLVLAEPQAAYTASSRKEGHTFADYLAQPEDVRVELIDGVFYDMAAPNTVHQAIAGYIHSRFLEHVSKNKGPCYPFVSPVDVLLDRDDRTCVQPDVLVICQRDRYRDGRIWGAPDLIVEVLSASTRKKDMQLKLQKYGSAGVREYWMVDPEQRKLIQYDLEHLDIPVIYGFEESVPVLIWDGACRVDLAQMTESMSFLWEDGRDQENR